ncbi:MAG: hypothetical protein EZS28_022637, partial [Streblomastix strix]
TDGGGNPDKIDRPEDDGWRGGNGYEGIEPKTQRIETYGLALYHNKNQKGRNSAGISDDGKLPRIMPAQEAGSGREESVTRLAQTLPQQSSSYDQQKDISITGDQSKLWMRPTFTETKHTQLTNRDPVFLTQVATRAYSPASSYTSDGQLRNFGSSTVQAHPSEVARLREFHGSQYLQPVPGMDPQFCRVCHGWSEILPFPNMCSMCVQRGYLISDRVKRDEQEAYENYETQAYLTRRDEEDLEEDRLALIEAKQKRAVVDEKNVQLIEERREYNRTHQDDDALVGGHVKLNDVFNYRADDTQLTPEQLRELGRKQAAQIDEQNERKRKFREEELEIGKLISERDIAKARELQERDIKRKYDMQEEQRLGLEAQLSEEEEARKYRMPRLVAYNRNNRNRAGEMVDPFTNQYESTPEELQEVKDNYKHILRQQWNERGIKEREDRERQLENERITTQMVKDALEKEIDEINREAADAQIKQKEAFEKQIAERVVPNYVYGYDDPNGDRFTRGLTPIELHTQKIQSEMGYDRDLRKQIDADNAKRDKERAEFLQEGEETIAHDAYELDCDRKTKEAHDAYEKSFKDSVEKQIEQQRNAKTADRDLWKTISNTTLSPMIGTNSDRLDCEKPYYRVKLITKKRRMMEGF